MKLVDTPIALAELAVMVEEGFGDLTKAVVDIRVGVMVVDGELHSDLEAFLLENGSEQADLWGINLYPDLPASDWIEFDSMINIRPAQGNRSRGIDDPGTKAKVVSVVESLVIR
jgi:hypothetical protein